MIKHFIGAIAIAHVCGAMAEPSGKDKYLQVYSEHILSNTGVFTSGLISEGVPAQEAEIRANQFVTKLIACHSTHLDSYPSELRTVLYRTIESGGSYPDAESALKISVSEAQMQNNQALLQEFSTAAQNNAQCVKAIVP